MRLITWLFDEYHSVWCDHRDKLAAQDPKWAEIEARRHSDGPGMIWLSKEHSLGRKEWEYQNEVEDRYLPHTWAHKLHWWMQDNGPSTQLSRLKHAWQRAQRGYDDSNWWNLHYYLADHLPPLLEQLAEDHHGVPTDMVDKAGGDVNEGSKIWAAELRDVAQKIRESNNDECAHDNGRCIKDVHCYVSEDNIKQAMVWLGEHWHSLWD